MEDPLGESEVGVPECGVDGEEWSLPLLGVLSPSRPDSPLRLSGVDDPWLDDELESLLLLLFEDPLLESFARDSYNW